MGSNYLIGILIFCFEIVWKQKKLKILIIKLKVSTSEIKIVVIIKVKEGVIFAL